MNLVSVFEDVYGVRPSTFAEYFGRDLEMVDWTHLKAAHERWADEGIAVQPSAGELWPLVSHHRFAGDTILRGLASDDATRLAQDAVAHLLLCNGLVLADPFRLPLQSLGGKDDLRARSEIARAVRLLAEIEPLVRDGIVVFAATHVPVSAAARAEVHHRLGLAGDLSVVTHLIEWSHFAEGDPNETAAFVSTVSDLCDGIPGIAGCSGVGASRAVLERLGGAAVEVSWQLSAIGALGGTPDVYLTSELEQGLLNCLIESEIADTRRGNDAANLSVSLGAGRHLQRVATGSMPRLDATTLTIADLIAIRRDGLFDDWRRALNSGLDRWADAVVRDGTHYNGEAELRESLESAASRVGASVRKSKLLSSVVSSTVTTAIAAAFGGIGVLLNDDHLPMIGVAAASSGVGALRGWLNGRAKPGANAYCRFVAAFGGNI